MLLMSERAYINLLKASCALGKIKVDEPELCSSKTAFRASPTCISACDTVVRTFSESDQSLILFCFSDYEGVIDCATFAKEKGIPEQTVKRSLVTVLKRIVSPINLPYLTHGMREGAKLVIASEKGCYIRHKCIIEHILANCTPVEVNNIEYYQSPLVPIEFLELGGRVGKALKEQGIFTLSDLVVSHLSRGLSSLKGVGGIARRHISTTLFVLGLLPANERVSYYGEGVMQCKGLLKTYNLRIF